MPSGDSAIFMCYGDVRGEGIYPGISKAPASGGWIPLLSVDFGAVVNYGQRTATHAEGGSEATPIRITKYTNASTTGMLRNALLGEHDKGVAIVFLRTDGEGPQEFMRLELVNAGITDFSIEGGEGDRSTETYAISFAEISVITWLHDGSTRGAQAVVTVKNQS